MPDLVTVSNVQKQEELRTYINNLFEQGKYEEITLAIGMHSILIDPEHMISDQQELYRLVLNLLKKKINRSYPESYSSWLKSFPSLITRLIENKQSFLDEASRQALASRLAAFGSFYSVDEFFFWSLDDRRLTLAQIVACIKKTVEMHRS